MRLNSIKLSGFKSFAEPTNFMLPGQLVGVVGPNGCGKSNIMDAVRWVLGESKASELRGESMQDVIFSGTTTRKQASRASVELVFDNSDHRAGGQWGQFGEIAVRRVLTRDGTSQYYINSQPVRRVQLSLYRRNPREWRKWAQSADEAITRTWEAVLQDKPLPELRGAGSLDAVRLAFEASGPTAFSGDRVAALTVGWAGLLKQANGDTWQQSMIDGVGAENAYRAARNFEISLWMLGSKLGPDGQLLLLSTEISERGRNLVADRELSKVVARLDLLAAQADEKYRRAAIDFSQNWMFGSLGPFLAMVKR